jgi:hypothetical protein
MTPAPTKKMYSSVSKQQFSISIMLNKYSGARDVGIASIKYSAGTV